MKHVGLTKDDNPAGLWEIRERAERAILEIPEEDPPELHDGQERETENARCLHTLPEEKRPRSEPEPDEDQEKERKFERYLSTLPEEQQPKSKPEKSRAFGEWEQRPENRE